MYPKIMPRDLPVIEAVARPLNKRDSGQYVLRRIIGVLTTIIRDGRELSVYEPKDLSFARLLPLRRLMLGVRNRFFKR